MMYSLLIPLAIVLFGYRTHLLTLSGSIAAFLVGSIIILTGSDYALMLIVFFFIGSATTKYKQKQKEAQMPYQEPEENDKQQSTPVRKGRDHSQVLATGLIPALLCLLSPFIHDRYFYLSYTIYLSVSCGDTLASELGMLSREKPIFIVNRERVERGIDGAMSITGTVSNSFVVTV